MVFKTNALIKKCHIMGFFWIVIIGSLLHFTYEWSGKLLIVGYFSPVNESLWEHLKLGYFAITFFILIEYWILRNKTDVYFFAKTAGIITMSLLIVVVAYIYETITKGSNIYFHIGLFIVSALVCQVISMNTMKLKLNRKVNLYSFIVYLIMGILLVILTPYQIEVFFSL